MNYSGVIIEESLSDTDVLGMVNITKTAIEKVTDSHKTPWLKQWTLHTVEITEDKADTVAAALSKSLDNNHWYADFKNDNYHYVIFPNKVFRVDRKDPEQYKPVVDYGLNLNIPGHQLDFSPAIKQWRRS